MRYDDPARPTSLVAAVNTPLQLSGSPLPTITLMYPAQSSGITDDVNGDNTWGWLCCIHAHRASNRFGTYYGWIRDLGQFQSDYLLDPEATLLKYFKYSGPEWEPTERSPRAAPAVQEIQEEIF